MRLLLKSKHLSVCAAVLGLGLAPAVTAQVPGAVYTVTVPSSQFGSSAFLGHLVSSLSAVQAFCASLGDPSLNVDCLAERLGEVAKAIPRGSNYDEVRKVLSDASNDLNRLARGNRDQARGTVRATAQVPVAETSVEVSTSRPLVAVKSESVAAVNAQATDILNEAQTILLRSADTGTIKASQYSQIADALDSNKVLLRST